MTFAHFQICGILALFNDFWYIVVNGLQITFCVSFISLGWNESGPWDLFGFTCLIAFNTKFSVILICSKVCMHGCSSKIGKFWSSSISKTLAKYSFKTSAVSCSLLFLRSLCQVYKLIFFLFSTLTAHNSKRAYCSLLS